MNKSNTHVISSNNVVAATRSRRAIVAAWILQGILALLFVLVGAMKLLTPIEQLAASLPWAAQVPAILVRFIGLAELLGGLGVILPSLLRIKPVLAPVAAAGLAVVMVLAAAFHLSRGESSMIGVNLILAALAALTAWLRFKKVPQPARG
jgi:uncharacterized membrane protein YphA (DoxX/SURF4 family)